MSTETLYPTQVTTPSVGGSSCSGTDTARTCTADATCDAGSERASADHKSFQSPSFQSYWTSADLKIVWRVEAQGTSEDECSTESVIYRYTLNASSWTTALTKTPSGSVQSGTYTKSLSTSQDISKVQVRIDSQAEATACPTGRCCYGTSGCDCMVVTQAVCTASSGIWTSGANCSGDPCWKPVCGGS